MPKPTANLQFDIIQKALARFDWPEYDIHEDVTVLTHRLAGAVVTALNEAVTVKELLGRFTRCTVPECRNGEFANKALERGWSKYANCLFCPDHKEP